MPGAPIAIRPPATAGHRGPRSRFLAAIAAVALTAVACAAATESAAAASIKGVWSFKGGRVAVHPVSGGGLAGTVVSPIRFADCDHVAGERMWTDVGKRDDGSYWGLHQWFFPADCSRDPMLGPSAWRVLPAHRGSSRWLEKHGRKKFLRVCYSSPGSGLQPTISRRGEVEDATYGCFDSALVTTRLRAPFHRYFRFLSNRRCIKRLKIRVFHNPNDPVRKIRVDLRGGKVERRAKVRRWGGNTYVVLGKRRIPRGRFAVQVRIRTVLGHRYQGKRSYRSCGRSNRG